MSRVTLLIFITLSCGSSVIAQTINGKLSSLQQQEIRLVGYNGFETYSISSTTIDGAGNFELTYSQNDVGVGYLISADEKPFLVILSGDDIEIQGEALAAPEKIKILEGEENLWFEQYNNEHPRREQALSALGYLENMYRSDSFFADFETPRQAIKKEKQRIRQEDHNFLSNLPKDSYVRWYLPVRKLVSSTPTVAQYRTEEIPETIEAFRQIDYTDERLHKSGLLDDVIESHVWLIENSGRSLDSVYVELNKSIDRMVENLSDDQEKFNEIADYLFELLENRSLFESSEYLALTLLNNRSELLDSRLASKLEIYRAMKIGNSAPDIDFTKVIYDPEGRKVDRLSELQSEYALVVFSAGWCQHCQDMITKLKKKYSRWQNQNVEVVLVSLDKTPEDFSRFASELPFITTTDFQEWDSPIVKDYHVDSIPTMILLDSEREILLHPNSLQHIDSWIDWYLVQGNR